MSVAPSTHAFRVSTKRWVAIAATVMAIGFGSTFARGEVFRLRGTGSLAGAIPPFGMLGEQVDFVVDIDSDLLDYDGTQAPAIHAFSAPSPFTLSMVGGTSGPFPDIDPVVLLRATDGAPGSADDLLEVHNGSAMDSVPLLTLRCPAGDCLDEANVPTQPGAFLSTLRSALLNPGGWMVESAQVGSSAVPHVYSVDNLDWSLRPISHELSTAATFDVQYVPGGTPELTEGEPSILVGGFSSTFPPTSTAILEFDISFIPKESIITGVTLRIDALSQQNSPTLTVVTYPGDGQALVDDGTADGLETMIGPVNLITAETLELDAPYVQSILGTASHLGVRLSSETSGNFLSMATLENTSSSTVPVLEIEYLFEAPLGDFNADGFVDVKDYVVWRNTLDSTTELAADANGNGEVDADDYLIWKAQYIASASGLAAPLTQVPEPVLWAWAFGLVTGALFIRRRTR